MLLKAAPRHFMMDDRFLIHQQYFTKINVYSLALKSLRITYEGYSLRSLQEHTTSTLAAGLGVHILAIFATYPS